MAWSMSLTNWMEFTDRGAHYLSHQLYFGDGAAMVWQREEAPSPGVPSRCSAPSLRALRHHELCSPGPASRGRPVPRPRTEPPPPAAAPARRRGSGEDLEPGPLPPRRG